MKNVFKITLSLAALVFLFGGATLFYMYAPAWRANPPAPSASPLYKAPVAPKDSTPAAPGFGNASLALGAKPVISSSPRTPPSGMREYRNAAYKMSLFYPEELAIEEHDEGYGARTFTFSDTGGEKSFQIFVLPYNAKFVTADRFRIDEPSGVIEAPTNIYIAGVPATLFFGRNEAMGDTREVWFIYGGFLYEVTTYKELDAWLSAIMQTWQFQ